MNGTQIKFGVRSARRIFPLGVVMGVIVLAPFLYYLAATADELRAQVGSAVYLIGAFSVVLAALVILLLFLWIGEWATEASQQQD